MVAPALSWQTVVVGDPLCAPFDRESLAREQLEEATAGVTELPGCSRSDAWPWWLLPKGEIPEAAGPLVVQSQTLLERGDSVGVRRALEEAVKLTPRGGGLMDIGKGDRAEVELKEALRLDPS